MSKSKYVIFQVFVFTFCNSHLLRGHKAIFRKKFFSRLTFNIKEVEMLRTLMTQVTTYR